ELIERWLSQRRGSRVAVRVPRRGEKRALLETVTDNAKQSFKRHRLKRSSDFASRSRQLTELQDALGMTEAPLRIECFDISNTGATEAVGSMVVLEDGLPKRSDYRRFAIKWTTGPDDFGMMAEVVRRRFSRVTKDSAEVDAARAPRRFAYPPNLIVIDGGKGQLNSVTEVMKELGINDIAVVSLAKRMEEVFVPGESEPIRIARTSEALYLLQSIRDEAHRFALTYHRLRRGKGMTRSALDGVPGLGEARKKKLLKHFGSVKRIREASLDELLAVSGLPRAVAEGVHESLSMPGARDRDVRPDRREAS
nr:excinuclease ABC subunit C [Actinomycetota bacterium]